MIVRSANRAAAWKLHHSWASNVDIQTCINNGKATIVMSTHAAWSKFRKITVHITTDSDQSIMVPSTGPNSEAIIIFDLN